MINVALLKEICETPGVPGHEQKVRELITRELKGIADSITTDNMGNLIAVKKRKECSAKGNGCCPHGRNRLYHSPY